MRRQTAVVLATLGLLSSTAAAGAAPIHDDVEDVRLRTHVRVLEGSSRSGRATIDGTVDIVVSCRPFPAGASGSCARRHRIGRVTILRIRDSGGPSRKLVRPKVRVVSDSTRRARIRIPVGPVTCRGVHDAYRLFFVVPLVLVGTGTPPEKFANEAPGTGCTELGRRSSRSGALRRARAAFSSHFRGTPTAGSRAFVDCRDENHGSTTWQCVRRVPTGTDRRGRSRCWRLTFTQVSPERFGRLERTSYPRVSTVSRESRVPYANRCRPSV